MSAAVMMKRFAEASPRLKARTAGSFLCSAYWRQYSASSSFAGWNSQGTSSRSRAWSLRLVLYDICKPVNRGLSLLAASFNLLGLTFGALRWKPRGVDITVVFGGFSCILIGYLIFRSTFLLRILSALMAFAGLGWVTYLSPPLANYLSPYNLAAGILGQESVMLWLLAMGVNLQRWKEQASAAG
jgi:hypothetical protein